MLSTQLGGLATQWPAPAHAGLELKTFGSGGFKEYTVADAFQAGSWLKGRD